jgi:hypothetical protein
MKNALRERFDSPHPCGSPPRGPHARFVPAPAGPDPPDDSPLAGWTAKLTLSEAKGERIAGTTNRLRACFVVATIDGCAARLFFNSLP